MHPQKKMARIAGFLYLLVTITGPFVLIYVPGKLFVEGDAAATASSILAHQTLFRSYIVVGIVAELLFISVVLVLYRLLKGVGTQLAAVMVITVLVDAPLAFLRSVNNVATLAFVRGAELLSVFDKSQGDALATMLIDVNTQGTLVSEVFWGLWLLPLGLLVYRSGFLPRFLGIWLILNGLAYLALSATGLLLPQFHKAAYTIVTPLILGEVALTFWLLIVGVRVQPTVAGVSQAEQV
ncbi:MAG: DUF4386 domain-containing protein [Desulfobacterales bacterium]|nr:DUF4386 domain-containing protein [Desulfobacterales bacterium]